MDCWNLGIRERHTLVLIKKPNIMKKYLIIAASALVAMCACTKNEVIVPDQEVTFQVANYVGQTKADDPLSGSAFTYNEFGCYAWSAAVVGSTYYMDNETISKKDGSWKPSTTYYWPKKANVDFISYFPRNSKENPYGVAIGESLISYTDIDVKSFQKDIMYADKVVDYGYADTANDAVKDGQNQYKQVPAFFHHALAQINVNVKLAYRSKTVPELDDSNTRYDWEMTLTKVDLKNVRTVGSLDLQLGAQSSALAKTYAWDACLPGTSTKTTIWKATDALSTVSGGIGAVKADVDNYVFQNYFVLPQAIFATNADKTVLGQEVELTFNIKTTRTANYGTEAASTTVLNETGVVATAKLINATDVTAWNINQATTYLIKIAPSAGPGTPNDDPDNPDLKDYEISFDPAVAGWDAKATTVTIML